MNENSRKETRDRLIMEALIARRLATEKEMTALATELENLRRQEQVLSEEVRLLDEILGAVPATRPAPSKFEAEQVHTILSPPIPVVQEPEPTPTPEATAPEEEAEKKRRKGLKRGELASILRKRFGEGEFALDQVVEILLEVEPGDRRKAYHAGWRTCGILEEAGIIQVVSETPSGKGVRKTYRVKQE